MIEAFLRAIGVVHIVVMVGLGLLNTWIWLRYPRRFPRYVHVLAVFALALGGLPFLVDTTLLTPANLPSILVLLTVLPTLVYVAFVFYGGCDAAAGEGHR